MSRRWALGAFLAVCIVQLAVPALLIRTYETALTRGRAFKVRCAPVDPADAFRGRYVWIGLELPAPEVDPGRHFTWGRRLWASIEEGPDGFARAVSIHRDRPGAGDVVPVRYAGVTSSQEQDRRGSHRFRLEIDRYYMPEAMAPEAERVYRRRAGQGQAGAHAVIRVLDGVAVIESLHVGGVPIEELISRGGPAGDEAGEREPRPRSPE